MRVVVCEARRLGSGASGRTGGVALPETAGGDFPDLGDVSQGFTKILQDLNIECGAVFNGVWEIGRKHGRADSPIQWSDSGLLRVEKEVQGGTVNPGKMLSGLARVARQLGARLVENTPVLNVEFGDRLRLHFTNGEMQARQVVFTSNAESLDLSGLAGRAEPMLTLAIATAPLKSETLEQIGLGQRKAFYTVDLPYLWGRVLPNNGVIFGAGLVHVKDWRELASLDVKRGAAADGIQSLEQRVRKLNPALADVKISHRWGGPMTFSPAGRPFFCRHPRSPNAIVLGGYTGQGVTLSLYLGQWAAEVVLARRSLPDWGRL